MKMNQAIYAPSLTVASCVQALRPKEYNKKRVAKGHMDHYFDAIKLFDEMEKVNQAMKLYGLGTSWWHSKYAEIKYGTCTIEMRGFEGVETLLLS